MPAVPSAVLSRSCSLIPEAAGLWVCAGGAFLCAFASTGCLGIFASDGTSVSAGSHVHGALVHGIAMPIEGAGYQVHPAWRERHRSYATKEVVSWLRGAFDRVLDAVPGTVAHLGDLSGQGGGGSAMHRSHASGRDVDIFYSTVDANQQPLRNLPAMLHFGNDGHATRWSTARTGQRIVAPVPDAHFDERTNWAIVQALLSDPSVEVQWIFIERSLAVRLLDRALLESAPPELLARAREIMHQPADSQPHDDHMHVRVYCDPGDRAWGCVDKGPKRWLKKHWKYMRGGEAVLSPLQTY